MNKTLLKVCDVLCDNNLEDLRDELLSEFGKEYAANLHRLNEKNIEIVRLQRKLRKKEAKLAGMRKHIGQLEEVIVNKAFDFNHISRKIENAVTNALCNVRMIPVIGKHKTARLNIEDYEENK